MKICSDTDTVVTLNLPNEHHQRVAQAIDAQSRATQIANKYANRLVRGIGRFEQTRHVIVKFEKSAAGQILSYYLGHEVDLEERWQDLIM